MAKPVRLTDAIVKRLPTPDRDNELTRDTAVKGYAACVTVAGSRSLVLDYRTRAGRQRRFTIGRFPDWSVGAGSEEARRLRREIDCGGEPLAEIEAERGHDDTIIVG